MAPDSTAPQPRSLAATTLAERLADPISIQLVDVREDHELELARLPQPVLHLPLSRASDWAPRITELLNRDRPVAVLCHSGIRSRQFGCWLLQEHGYGEVWNVEGGIDAWSREVDVTVPRY
jgi:rhodanese-related sulfurtransferase